VEHVAHMGEMRNVWSENLKLRDNSEDLGVLAMNLREIGWEVVDRIHLAQGPLECFFEYGNGPSGSIKVVHFLTS